MPPDSPYDLLAGGRIARIHDWGGATADEAEQTLSALLTTGGGAQYGVARMVQAHAEFLGLEMEVITDQTRALGWLREGLAGEARPA